MQLLAASAATNSYAIENLACHSQAILSSVLAPTHSVTVSKVATDQIQPHDHPSFAVAAVLPVGRPMIKPDKHAAIWAMQPDRLRRSELAPRGCDPITMSDRVSGSAACVTLRAIFVLHTHEQQHFCWLNGGYVCWAVCHCMQVACHISCRSICRSLSSSPLLRHIRGWLAHALHLYSKVQGSL